MCPVLTRWVPAYVQSQGLVVREVTWRVSATRGLVLSIISAEIPPTPRPRTELYLSWASTCTSRLGTLALRRCSCSCCRASS